MKLIYSRNLYATVRRPGHTGPVEVEVDFADSAAERLVWFQLDVTDLKVIEARWEEYRSQGAPPARIAHDVPGLLGVEMYFDCGKAIGHALPDDPDGQVTELFKEGVKVLIQAEPLFLEERGFPSLEAYQRQLWEKIDGSCYYLAHPDCNPNTVRDKFQFHHRKENLFSRHRSVFVYDDGEEYRSIGTISDGWHEMQADISVRKEGFEVTRAVATFVRGPDALCMESAELLGGIVGQRFTPENSRTLLKAGGNGCAHLIDLTREAMRSVHCDWVQQSQEPRWPRRGGGGDIRAQK